MRIVVAPDKFKGSLSAVEAAEAIGRGVTRARPDAEVAVSYTHLTLPTTPYV